MKELEILNTLILDTKYGDFPWYLATREKERKELHELGLYDDDNLKMTEKGKTLLLDYYDRYKDKVLFELKKAKSQNYNYQELSDVCELPSNSLLLKFILRRLADEDKIALYLSDDWDEKIKFIVK